MELSNVTNMDAEKSEITVQTGNDIEIRNSEIAKAMRAGEAEMIRTKLLIADFRNVSGFHRSANVSVFLAEPPEADENSWEMWQWKLADFMESSLVK